MKLRNRLKNIWRRIRAGALALVISVFSVLSHGCSSLKVYAAVSPADSIVFGALETILLTLGVNAGIISEGHRVSGLDKYKGTAEMDFLEEYYESLKTKPHGSALRDAWDNVWRPETVPEEILGNELYKVLEAISNDQKVGVSHDDEAGTTTVRIPAHTWETIEDLVTPAVGTSTFCGIADMAAATDEEIADAVFSILRNSKLGDFPDTLDTQLYNTILSRADMFRYGNFCIFTNLNSYSGDTIHEFVVLFYPQEGTLFTSYALSPFTDYDGQVRVIYEGGGTVKQSYTYDSWSNALSIRFYPNHQSVRMICDYFSTGTYYIKCFHTWDRGKEPNEVIAWNGKPIASWLGDGDLAIDRYPGYVRPDLTDVTDDTYVTVTVPDGVDLSDVIDGAIATGWDDALTDAGVVVGTEEIPEESDRDKEFVAVVNPAIDIPTDTPAEAPGFELPELKYDITKRFPLCIPFDVKRLFGAFRSDIIEAPVFHMRMDFPMVDYTMDIEIDMADYEEQVAIFRQGMRVLLLLGLLFGTHKLIKWH